MSDVTWLSVPERARVLRESLADAGDASGAGFVDFLSTADAMEASQFRAKAESAARGLVG